MKKTEIFNWYKSDRNIQKLDLIESVSSWVEYNSKGHSPLITVINKALINLSNHKTPDEDEFINSLFIERIEVDENQLNRLIRFFKDNRLSRPLYSLNLDYLCLSRPKEFNILETIRIISIDNETWTKKTNNLCDLLCTFSLNQTAKNDIMIPIKKERDGYIKAIFENVKALEFNEFSDVKFDLEDEMLKFLDNNAA